MAKMVIGPVCLAALLASACTEAIPVAEPQIQFETVPVAAVGGPDRMATFTGRVTAMRPGQRIVLFAKSGPWYVQPFKSDPYTEIGPDLRWSSPTHLGTEYAALLVSETYRPPVATAELPPVGDEVLAVATVRGTGEMPPAVDAAAKVLTFGGYGWEVRQVPSDRGGTNPYHPDNAWVASDGTLHLKLAKRDDVWTSAEVRLIRSLGYGTYLFTIRDVLPLDPAVVVSMITSDESAANSNYRELAVEIGQLGGRGPGNTQYVVQPYYLPENLWRFSAPVGTLTHSLTWQPGRALFSTSKGRTIIAQHEFVTGIPQPGRERAYFNVYYYRHGQLEPERDTEIVIERFQYLP